jgi:predicted HTH transcriptional regulator
MNKLSDDKISTLLEISYELRNREFKDAFCWSDKNNTWIKEKITRAILGMTNIKSGGNIIIGVGEEKNTKKLLLNGLSKKQLDSFEDFDGIKGYVDGFSSNQTFFNIAYGEYKDKKFVVMSVEEFSEIPVLCKKNGVNPGILVKDDLYTRSMKGVYGTAKATELELREMIKMASDKEKTELNQRDWYKKENKLSEIFFTKQISDL